MSIDDTIQKYLKSEGADCVYFVDVSSLPHSMTRGFPNAILFMFTFSPKFLSALIEGKETDRDEFEEKEIYANDLADRLADFIESLALIPSSEQQGANSVRSQNINSMHPAQPQGANAGMKYRAYSQSENNLLLDGELQGSPLPHKTIGRIGGIGFIGKNALLITDSFGPALSMCSVLTDAPLMTENGPIKAIACGKCTTCTEACPTGAIKGALWTPSKNLDELVDIKKCSCVLKCMVACPWTHRYIEQNRTG